MQLMHRRATRKLCRRIEQDCKRTTRMRRVGGLSWKRYKKRCMRYVRKCKAALR